MKNLFDSIVRTPGVLFMGILATGFTVNAGVQYINATNLEGPNLMAAGLLVVSQFALIVVQQLRRVCQSDTKLTLQ